MRADADVLILGAGHGGLAVAHDLVRAGRDMLLVDAHVRVGDAWRTRWDSLRLFTPRELDALPGIPFPAGDDPFPNKDEVADYQERYASELGFPIRLGAALRDLRRHGGVFEAYPISRQGSIRRCCSSTAVTTAGRRTCPWGPSSSWARPTPAARSRSRWRATGRPRSRSERGGRCRPGDGGPRTGGSSRSYETVCSTSAPRRSAGSRGPFAPAAISRPISIVPRPCTGSASLRARWMRPETPCALRVVAWAPARTVIWATGYRAEHSWIDVPKEDGVVVIGRHGRGPVPGLHFVRGRFLFAISRHARDVARDVGHEG